VRSLRPDKAVLLPSSGRGFMGQRRPTALPYPGGACRLIAHSNDPSAVGRTFRMDNRIFTVIGVSPKGFTGTEPGTMIDVFVPTMMHEGITHSDWSWFRTLAILRPGVRADTVREKLQPAMQVFHEERAKGFKTESKLFLARFLSQKLLLDPPPADYPGCKQSIGARSSCWDS
jgi:hypothetical protein